MTQPTRRQFFRGVGAGAAAFLLPVLHDDVSLAEDTTASTLTIGGVPVRLTVASVTPRTTRISVLQAGTTATQNQVFPGNGLLNNPWPSALHQFSDLGAPHSFSCGTLHVTVSNDPLRVHVEDSTHRIKQELRFNAVTGNVTFLSGDAPVFGLGEGGRQFNRKGALDRMQNGKSSQLAEDGSRNPIPWLLSPAGWAIYFHHPLGEFDLTQAEGTFRPLGPLQPQDIFISLAEQPADLMREYATLTGFPHLPPLWAFGYQQSHRTLTSRQQLLAEAETFRQKKLPCDVMIYLGTGYAPSGWNQGPGSFAFNPSIFPDPKQIFQHLHENGFRVALHVMDEPHGLHGSVNDPPNQDADAASSYWPQHVPVVRTGIDGWWVDDGDELSPESRLARNRLYWEGMVRERPNRRPYTLNRNSYAGTQMYGWLWSGDIQSAWKTLRTQVANGINTSLSGLPYWGTDTGGFASSKELTSELYVRWFQFSSFCTLFRSHGRTWNLRLPWGWNTGSYGPVEDARDMLPSPDELHHPEVEDICRKYLELRYRLLPYLYSMAYSAHTTGMPIMRALWLHHPQDPIAAVTADEYMWGDNILVAPITEKGVDHREVYLPQGTWYDFWTEETLDGGRTHRRDVDLATLPLYVRAGTILPLGAVKQHVFEPNDEPMTLRIYPGRDGEFALYEDDGLSFDYQKRIRSRRYLSWSDTSKKLTISMGSDGAMYPFSARNFVLQLVGSSQLRAIQMSGAPVEAYL